MDRKIENRIDERRGGFMKKADKGREEITDTERKELELLTEDKEFNQRLSKLEKEKLQFLHMCERQSISITLLSYLIYIPIKQYNNNAKLLVLKKIMRLNLHNGRTHYYKE